MSAAIPVTRDARLRAMSDARRALIPGESLERVVARIDAAGAGAADHGPEVVLRATAGAFFEFCRDSPRDLDLGFYLFPGIQPRGAGEWPSALVARCRP